MTAARIARGGGGGGGRGPASRPRPKARGGARKSRPEGLLESVGFEPGTARRIGRWSFALFTLAVVVAAIFAFRLPQIAGLALGEGVGRAGFTLKRVEITGARRVSRLAIYNVAFDQDSMAMPLVDLSATRARLLEFGWIRDAQVSRRLPDTLVVHVIEREPAAIWQNNQQLSLIDAEGVVLEPVRLEAMPELPLLIGPQANRHVAALDALLETAPRLRPQVAGATWVGRRRWDIRFQSGELLSLPEGDEAARRAILVFARMDQQTSMLGRGYARIDMRIPDRAIVRLTREPGATVPQLAPPDPGAPPADFARTI